VLVLLAVVLGRAQEVQYADQHYANPLPFLGEGGPREAYTFARRQHDKRIGIIGSSEIIFGQYGFYGADLSNRVEYIGQKGPHGTYRLPTSCQQFRRLVNEGDYDYLVMSQFTQDSPTAEYRYPIYAWSKTDPALKQVVSEPEIFPQPDYVFKVNGKTDPAGCANIGK
jgi:hypothetical protein